MQNLHWLTSRVPRVANDRGVKSGRGAAFSKRVRVSACPNFSPSAHLKPDSTNISRWGHKAAMQSLRIEISHGGEEQREAIHQEIEEEKKRKHPKRPDWRTRRDRIDKRTRAFDGQMKDLVEMYGEWVAEGQTAPVRREAGTEEGGYSIRVVDILACGWLLSRRYFIAAMHIAVLRAAIKIE
ncbi:hypothetical protein B0H13DRAFT_1893283 [Mycena leptocephala]|nr:hypothetical protein B0H13DRAFT_1893283 [Mycena leptocephala]